MENYKKKAINLLIELALSKNKNPSVIPYKPGKTSVSKKESSSISHRIGGENYRYAPVLFNMLCELEDEKRANVHSITVLKNSEIILEAAAPGYDTRIWHLAHSMSKTVTGLAIGFLYDEKKISLEDNVLSFFGTTEANEKYSDLTIYDLLTMRAGSGFAELGTVTDNQWLDSFFESKPTSKIGEEFSYNSINSYILGRIITIVTGKSLYEFVTEKLFTPLGIENHFWEESAEGYTKGGFGLYLSGESFAKLGLLILGRGSFSGKRILSEEYISKMCRCAANAPNSIGDFDYGMHVWVSPDGEEILFNGMFGQNVWIYPKASVLAVLNSGNNELFSDSPALAIIRRNLRRIEEDYVSTRDDIRRLKAKVASFFFSRRSVVPKQEKRGLLYFLGLKEKRPFDDAFSSLLGKYATRDNNVGILPLLVSVMQNNYTGGIDSFEFSRVGEKLIMTVTEGGVPHTIPVGLYDYEETLVDFKGEKYIIKSAAEILFDENRNPIYKIELIYPELPNVRILKITHTEEGIRIRMSETPNEKIAESYLESFTSSTKGKFITGIIEKKMGEGFINDTIFATFNPALDAIDAKNLGFKDILAADNRKIAEDNEKNAKLFKTLASKFLSEEKDTSEKEDNAHSPISSFFKNALSLLLKFAKVKPDEAEKDTVIEIPDDTITFLDFNGNEGDSGPLGED